MHLCLLAANTMPKKDEFAEALGLSEDWGDNDFPVATTGMVSPVTTTTSPKKTRKRKFGKLQTKPMDKAAGVKVKKSHCFDIQTVVQIPDDPCKHTCAMLFLPHTGDSKITEMKPLPLWPQYAYDDIDGQFIHVAVGEQWVQDIMASLRPRKAGAQKDNLLTMRECIKRVSPIIDALLLQTLKGPEQGGCVLRKYTCTRVCHGTYVHSIYMRTYAPTSLMRPRPLTYVRT